MPPSMSQNFTVPSMAFPLGNVVEQLLTITVFIHFKFNDLQTHFKST